jgi:hypothetical protein
MFLTDGQAVIVPAEDVEALAASSTSELWNHPLGTRKIARRGRMYSEVVQGEERLLRHLQTSTM